MYVVVMVFLPTYVVSYLFIPGLFVMLFFPQALGWRTVSIAFHALHFMD